MPGTGVGAGAAEQFYSEPEPEPELECCPGAGAGAGADQKCHGSASLLKTIDLAYQGRTQDFLKGSARAEFFINSGM